MFNSRLKERVMRLEYDAEQQAKVDGPATVLVIKGNQVKKSKGKR